MYCQSIKSPTHQTLEYRYSVPCAMAFPPPPHLLLPANDVLLPALPGFPAGTFPTAADVARHEKRYNLVASMVVTRGVTAAEVGDAMVHLHKVEHLFIAGAGGVPVGKGGRECSG